jgi:hypothetical protein
MSPSGEGRLFVEYIISLPPELLRWPGAHPRPLARVFLKDPLVLGCLAVVLGRFMAALGQVLLLARL